jgi:hypothetical protein
LSQPRRQNVAHDALVDLIGIQSGTLHRLAHHYGAQLRSAYVGETTLELSNRGTASGNNYDIVKSRH